jgi:hypothetical protein
LLLPPVDAAAVRSALGRLRIAPLFAGFRGRPPLDWAAVARAAHAVAAQLEAQGGRVRSVDVNPLLVSRDGPRAFSARPIEEPICPKPTIVICTVMASSQEKSSRRL